MSRLAKTKIKRANCGRRAAGRKQPKIFKLNILFCVLIFALIAGYLFLLNSTTADGYKLKKIEKQVGGLKEENRNLTLELSDKQSMENVKKRVDRLGMVETGKFDYIKMQSSAVAKR